MPRLIASISCNSPGDRTAHTLTRRTLHFEQLRACAS
jgi:hypothetical protein